MTPADVCCVDEHGYALAGSSQLVRNVACGPSSHKCSTDLPPGCGFALATAFDSIAPMRFRKHRLDSSAYGATGFKLYSRRIEQPTPAILGSLKCRACCWLWRTAPYTLLKCKLVIWMTHIGNISCDILHPNICIVSWNICLVYLLEDICAPSLNWKIQSQCLCSLS